jgi:hypothetical protein
MALSADLISQFVKMTKDDTKKSSEASVYGTVVSQDEKSTTVQLDGSEVVTPVSSTVKLQPGERVIIKIKDHSAVVTGNLSTQAARSDTVEEHEGKITDVEILVASKASIKQLNAEIVRINNLTADNVVIRDRLTANEAIISDLEANNLIVNEKLTAAEADIETLRANVLTVDVADLKYASIGDLKAVEAVIYNLDVTYASAEQLQALEAEIDTLTANTLTVENASLMFANIDFTNIGDAAIENLFSKTGIIDNLVVSDGHVTGRLVGVTIVGDLIEGGTVVADKLVIQGEDGMYYKLNTDGVTTEAEQTDYNSLNGRIITAHSITAEKIRVDDLVAFDATIGGFNITDRALFSGVKESIDNSTNGVYLDSEGQVVFGNADNYVKFYAIYTYYSVSLDASTGVYTRSGTTVNSPIGTLVDGAITNDGYQVYSTSDGTSYFCRIATDYKLAISADSILFGTDAKYSMDDVKQLTDHVKIGSYVDAETGEQLPCVELSESDSDFKMRLTNKSATFSDGVNDSTTIDSDGIETENLRVKHDIRHYDYVWRRRANGNLGLMWMEVTD